MLARSNSEEGGDLMAWVVIQKAAATGWAEYEQVSQAVGADENPPAGLIVHAAGEENGKWCSVDIWESEADFERFQEERLLPAARAALGDAIVDAGPPPQESFEVKHLIKPWNPTRPPCDPCRLPVGRLACQRFRRARKC